MKKYLNKKNIIIFLVLATIVYFVFQPSLPKKLLETIRKGLILEDENLIWQNDSINNSRIYKISELEQNLVKKDEELEEVSIQLQDANVKIRRYELQILDYRYRSYNERFNVFTNLIAEADSLHR